MLRTVRHTNLSRVMKKPAEGFVKYRMMESMTAHRNHDGPSRGPSTRTRFDRFSAIKVLLFLSFSFINRWKNLIFGVRLFVVKHLVVRIFVVRLLDIRLCDCYTFGESLLLD